jgi:hypothetical protein
LEGRFYEALDDCMSDDDNREDAEEEEPYVPAASDAKSKSVESDAVAAEEPMIIVKSNEIAQSVVENAVTKVFITKSTTCYLPGTGGTITISDSLLDQIRQSLEESVPLQAQRIGKLKRKIVCFHGANVVDRIMDNGYAADRAAATRLALKLYTNGIIRALQPGGFVDSKDRLFRFRQNTELPTTETLNRTSSTVDCNSNQSMETSNMSTVQTQQPPQMFCISKILAANSDWLNKTWTQESDESCTETEDNDPL